MIMQKHIFLLFFNNIYFKMLSFSILMAHIIFSAIERLEMTISKLKSDLQAARKNELNVKDRLEYLVNLEKVAKSDLAQLRKDNELLQTK